MKCEECLLALDEYEYGELEDSASGRVAAHLAGCRACARERAELRRERELYAGREVKAPATLWAGVVTRIESEEAARSRSALARARAFFAGAAASRFRLLPTAAAAAALLIACAGLVSHVARRDVVNEAVAEAQPGRAGVVTPTPREPDTTPPPAPAEPPRRALHGNATSAAGPGTRRGVRGERRTRAAGPANAQPPPPRMSVASGGRGRTTRPDADAGGPVRGSAADSGLDAETARHIERAQMLLRSFKNGQFSPGERALDVVYEKQFSRDLVGRNILLRGDARSSGNQAVEHMLSRLEPFLLDIANLQEGSADEQVRSIKERMRREGIVESLRLF